MATAASPSPAGVPRTHVVHARTDALRSLLVVLAALAALVLLTTWFTSGGAGEPGGAAGVADAVGDLNSGAGHFYDFIASRAG